MAGDAGGDDRDTRKAWNEVGDQFSELGRRFSQHYRRQGRDATAAAEEQRQAMNEAFRKAVDQLDQAFTSVGEALRDPETKKSLNQAVRSLGDALGTTFQNLGSDIGRRVGGGGTRREPPPGDEGKVT